jgi:hypothetical protein
MFIAMNDRTLALSAGSGEEVTLGAFLNAPAASEPVFLRMHMSGAMYAQLGGMFDKIAPMIPEEQRADIDSQKQMFALYEKWIAWVDFSLIAKNDGVALIETVETR